MLVLPFCIAFLYLYNEVVKLSAKCFEVEFASCLYGAVKMMISITYRQHL